MKLRVVAFGPARGGGGNGGRLTCREGSPGGDARNASGWRWPVSERRTLRQPALDSRDDDQRQAPRDRLGLLSGFRGNRPGRRCSRTGPASTPAWTRSKRTVENGPRLFVWRRNAFSNGTWLGGGTASTCRSGGRRRNAIAKPRLGHIPADRIDCVDVLPVLSPIRGVRQEAARSVRQRIRTVMRWVIAHGYGVDNPAGEAIDRPLRRIAGPRTPVRPDPLTNPATTVSNTLPGSRSAEVMD